MQTGRSEKTLLLPCLHRPPALPALCLWQPALQCRSSAGVCPAQPLVPAVHTGVAKLTQTKVRSTRRERVPITPRVSEPTQRGQRAKVCARHAARPCPAAGDVAGASAGTGSFCPAPAAPARQPRLCPTGRLNRLIEKNYKGSVEMICYQLRRKSIKAIGTG